MTGKSHRTPLTTALLLAAAMTATPAWGQTQVQNGGALDANQRVGSGRFNPAAGQVDYQARNLLITGQVGGGRSFQGDVGYTTPGVFNGNLGSDLLFDYRRDSVYSAPGGVNFANRGGGDRVIVTRPTTSVSGLLVGSGTRQLSRSQYNPSTGVLTFRQSGGGLVSISGIDDPTQFRTNGMSIGLIETPQGLVSVDASPLRGVRYNPLNPAGLNPIDDRVSDTPPEIDTDTDTPDPLDISPERRIDGQRNPTQDPEDYSLFDLPEDPLTITLGTQLQSAMQLKIDGRVDNNIPNAQAQAIREQVFGPEQTIDPNEPPQAPQNPYDQLIADILAQSQGVVPDEPDPGTEPADDERPRWQQILEEPEKAILEAKLKSRDMALRQQLGFVDDEGNIDFDRELPTIDPESELGKLLADLDYDLPRVNTLAGKDENRINKLLTRGEQELKAGRYTVSESVYRQVLRETGDNPLAKAGLVHSQMGAGMIRSSAFNLRGLFSANPELIALRYDAELLPDKERLRWLQGRLQKQIADENPGADPGLILAYLGYQLEYKEMVEFGLAVAETEAPRDPLMPVLRRIWLEGDHKKGEKEEDTEKAGDAEK